MPATQETHQAAIWYAEGRIFRPCRICLILPASLRYLPPPGRVSHKVANRRASARIPKENNGEGRARGATWRPGGDRGGVAATRAAAGGALESAVLRRYRHADRGRRYLVLPKDPDRAAGFSQIVRFRAQARRGEVFPGDAGGEGRDRGRGRAF